MDYYLLFFGIAVLILFSIGIFLTIYEFREMSSNPEDYQKDTGYHKDSKKRIDIES